MVILSHNINYRHRFILTFNRTFRCIFSFSVGGVLVAVLRFAQRIGGGLSGARARAGGEAVLRHGGTRRAGAPAARSCVPG